MKKIIFVIALVLGSLSFSVWGDSGSTGCYNDACCGVTAYNSSVERCCQSSAGTYTSIFLEMGSCSYYNGDWTEVSGGTGGFNSSTCSCGTGSSSSSGGGCGTNEVSCGTNGCVDIGNCSGSRDGLNGNYNTYGGVPSSDCSGYQLCSVARECSPVTATNVYYGECFCSEAYLKTKCTSAQTYDTDTCTCSHCSGEIVDNHCCTNEIPTNAHATYTGGSCGWECNTNYTQVSGQNICCDTSSIPANAHATYTNGSCGWACDSDYTKVNNTVCCLTSVYNTCTNSGGTLENSCSCSCPTPPAHAHYTALSSGSCNWECDSGYTSDGTACVCGNSSQKTYCETITPAVGYITGTWNEDTCTCTCPENSTSSETGCVCSGTLPAHASYVSGSCDWTCNGDYIKNTDETACICPSNQIEIGEHCCPTCTKENSHPSYENETCGCACDEGFNEVESICCPICSDDKEMTVKNGVCACVCPNNQEEVNGHCCDTSSIPSNAHATYTNGSCGWECDSNYTQVSGQNICCDISSLPANAHVTYTNGTCGWECDSDYQNEAGTCVCNKTCENGMLDAKTCSCVCTEITCDGPHQELSYENESCGCHCQEDFDEVESNICCPTCASDDQMAAYRENQCTCICKNADQTLVGNKCCETCLTPKEATTDESGACACDCPLGTDNTNRLLYNEANNTCVECQENAEGDYRHYHWGSVPCCPVLATNNTTTPSSVATVSPQASSQTTTTSPITAPVLNSLSAILQKFSALTDEVPAPVATQTTSTPSSASSGSESFTNLQNELQTEKESKIESESQKEETSQERPPYDENGSVLLKLKDIQIVSMGNAPSFCSGNLEIQNKMKGTLSTLVLNLKYDSTTIPLSFSSVEDDQILTKKLSLVGPSCRQFSSTPQVVIVKCVIKGAESDTSACRGRIKFLITD